MRWNNFLSIILWSYCIIYNGFSTLFIGTYSFNFRQIFWRDRGFVATWLRRNKKNTGNEWKIQINMGVNFISSNDTGQIRTFYVNSDNEEIRLGNEADEIITKLFKSFLNNYQKEEKILRNGSNFVFESVYSLTYRIHKINLKRGKSYIKSSEWILNKRATTNPKNKDNKNKDNKCFEYATAVALNHQNILLTNIIGKA